MIEKYLTGSEGSNDGISGLLSPDLIDTVSMILFGSNEKEDTKYRVQFRSAYGGISHKDSMKSAKPIADFHKSLLLFKNRRATIVEINFDNATVDFRTRKPCVSVSIGKDELEGESNIMAIHPSEVFFIDYNSDKDIELIKDQVKKAKMIGLFDGTVNDYR